MNKSLLGRTANKMVAEKRGILAADESSGTIAKRLESSNVKSTPENNRRYRGLLFTTSGMEKFISADAPLMHKLASTSHSHSAP